MTHGKKHKERDRELKKLFIYHPSGSGGGWQPYEFSRNLIPKTKEPSWWQKVKQWITKLIS